MARFDSIHDVKRREYDIQLKVNGRSISKVIVDPHYEVQHSGSITDEIILRLLDYLNGKEFEPVDRDGPYEYFVEDKILIDRKLYKLIWLLEDHQIYVGVINAYRRD